MPSITYMNRSAPFWDWVASLEQDGMNHPWFSHSEQNEAETGRGPHGPHGPPLGPWGWGFPGFGGRAFPHRGPPPRDETHHNEGDGEAEKHNDAKKDNEKDRDMEDANDNGEGPSGSGSETEGCHRRRGRRGSCHGRGGPHHSGNFGGRHSHGPHHGGPRHHGRRGGWAPWGRGGFGGPPFNPLAFAGSFFEPESSNKDPIADFKPEADIFDTQSAFVIHVSLPGAKKEDVGVNWDAEKSELSIAGVVYRPGDEELLKTLAMDERKVGPFERKVRLGTRANPALVDVDGISAKLEDGVLRVEVPKLSDSGFVEVRKVDVE